MGDRQGNRDQRREDWQGNRDERREDWQDYADDRREDRQDFWDDRSDNWNEVDWDEVDWNEVEVWDDDDFEWNTGAWMALSLGTALTVSAFNSMSSQAACNLTQVIVDETEYFKCGSTWYIKGYQGGELRYIAVDGPAGY